MFLCLVSGGSTPGCQVLISGFSGSPTLKHTGIKWPQKMPDAENKQIKDIVTWLVNCINTVFAWMQKDVNLNYHVKHVPFTLEECHSPNWLISVVEVVAFMKQSCLLGEMFYGSLSLSQEMFEVYFSAENKSSMMRRDDLKMIWWLVLSAKSLQIFNFNILFPKHDNLKCPFVCDLYYMIHLILYIWFTLFHVVLYI